MKGNLSNRLYFQAIDRLAVLEVASADARAEASEQTAKMDLVSRDLRALTKSYHKLRNELIDFQSKVSLDNPELGGDNGHYNFHSTCWIYFNCSF